MNGWEAVIAARDAMKENPGIINLQEDLGFVTTCADCWRYPLKDRDYSRYCRSARDYSDFGTSPCDRLAENDHHQSFGLALNKFVFYKTKLARLSQRLEAVRQNPLSMLTPHRRALQQLSLALKDCKKAIDEEQQRIGCHPQAKRLRNLREKAVYIVECAEFTKIGFTSTPVWRRMQGHKTCNPFPMKLIAVFPGDMKRERQLHEQFKTWRYRGEWFRLDEEAKAELMAVIENHKGALLTPPLSF